MEWVVFACEVHFGGCDVIGKEMVEAAFLGERKFQSPLVVVRMRFLSTSGMDRSMLIMVAYKSTITFHFSRSRICPAAADVLTALVPNASPPLFLLCSSPGLRYKFQTSPFGVAGMRQFQLRSRSAECWVRGLEMEDHLQASSSSFIGPVPRALNHGVPIHH